MSETAIVSSRRQITLPAHLRKRLDIKAGDSVLLEEKGNEIVLKPALAVEFDCYSDDQVAEWDQADCLTDRDRKRIFKAADLPNRKVRQTEGFPKDREL